MGGAQEGFTEAILVLQPGRQGARLTKVKGKNMLGRGRNKCRDSEPGVTLVSLGVRQNGSVLSARGSTWGRARAVEGSLWEHRAVEGSLWELIAYRGKNRSNHFVDSLPQKNTSEPFICRAGRT